MAPGLVVPVGSPAGRFVGLTNFGGITRAASLDVEGEAWHMVFGRRAFFGYYPARKASEEKAGGSLTQATNGVTSIFMTPTDYSPTR